MSMFVVMSIFGVVGLHVGDVDDGDEFIIPAEEQSIAA